MEAKEIQKAIHEWQDANDEKRTAFSIIVERQEEDENGQSELKSTITFAGNENVLVEVLKAILRACGTKEASMAQNLMVRTFVETFIDFINENNHRIMQQINKED